ncbi:hypothetical protein FisN_9Hh094 [Fistulifera solaris]|uniref:Nuclear control of ATPase protein 2 n=1 Tax=Fistulifera solaris TaxID=1519565 RepID=A0A1Z5K2V0_FISSO|nr:hypothetical protein FisN_9Hh094 [Fistulifera solaris]|eukprot:GAX20381.1 hypothetical protein FisN_9Hh094 [Fistulifera solaris]
MTEERSSSPPTWMSPPFWRSVNKPAATAKPPAKAEHRRRRSLPLRRADFAAIFQNPYSSVRGLNYQQPSSLTAVRNLLSVVAPDDEENAMVGDDESTSSSENDDPAHDLYFLEDVTESAPLLESSRPEERVTTAKGSMTPTATASQLAEGTLRALRDLALDEAVALNAALHYWTRRWERPFLGWLEAGPLVWFSRQGYRHELLGEKVSHLQAVLVRRCSAIGELQQHLLRSGLQEGVAQWGFLGLGGQWAAVAGAHRDGQTEIKDYPRYGSAAMVSDENKNLSPHWRASYCEKTPQSSIPATQFSFGDASDNLPYRTNLSVQKNPGGGIVVDNPGRLAAWSVDAIYLIRRYLYRCGFGMVALPYEANWTRGKNGLPIWASDLSDNEPDATFRRSDSEILSEGRESTLTIVNVPALLSEVEGITDIMEGVMQIQRKRRLEVLKPPGWFSRNWYLVATSVPLFGSMAIWLVRNDRGRTLFRSLKHSMSSFFKERLKDPIVAIFSEVWKGRDSFSDAKARTETIEVLKKMIRSWLDDYYPEMSKKQRQRMADAMDVSLIENKKEESMKTFYEINNVIRMSFIEMQYMKKEMMNALQAMDEMMSANDININIAAITPAAILAYGGSRIFKYLLYAVLKLGRSREEIFGSFRKILTDIERLLVMRDNQPTTYSGTVKPGQTQLGPDDLGMLMLLIHECRTLMWQNPRRFSLYMVSVSEDLAELAGERGKKIFFR